MLSIRLQRTGRKGHANYRVVVQDSHQSPTSGKFIARLGHYDPHTKEVVIDKEQTETFLKNGAQPSPRVVSLLTAEKIALPAWVKQPAKKERTTRNADKLRKNRPAEEAASVEETSAEADAEAPVEEKPAEAEEPAPEAEKTEE